MLKLKLQYFGHFMRRVDLLEKTLMLGGIEGRNNKGKGETEIENYNCKGGKTAKYVLLNITLPAERELNLKCGKALSNYLFLFI